MTAVDFVNQLLTVGNIVAAMYAFHWSRRAAKHTNPKMRPAYAGVAALTAVYICAYVVLLVMGSTAHRTEWSQLKAPIDIVAMVFVFARPAQNSVRIWEENSL